MLTHTDNDGKAQMVDISEKIASKRIAKAKKELNLKISINLNDSINSTIKSLNDKN